MFDYLLPPNHNTLPVPIKKDYGNAINLSSNQMEAPILTTLFGDFIKQYASIRITRYPAIDTLRQQIAEALQVSHDQLLFSPGSDAFIFQLLAGITHHRTSLIMTEPNYTAYHQYAKLMQITVYGIPVLFKSETQIINQFRHQMQRTPNSLIVLTCPDNMIGQCLSTYTITTIIQEAAQHDCFVLMDAAYADFCKENYFNLINQYRNLAVLQTLSKSYGFAGLRLAWIFSQKPMIHAWRKGGIERGCSDLSFAYLRYCLSQRSCINQLIDTVIAHRQAFYQQLKIAKPSWRLFKSHTNFQAFQVDHSQQSNTIIDHLDTQGFKIKALQGIFIPDNTLRATITPDKNIMNQLTQTLINTSELQHDPA